MSAIILIAAAANLPSLPVLDGAPAIAMGKAMMRAAQFTSQRTPTAFIELFADPDGKVIDCAVQTGDAQAKMEKSLCKAIQHKTIKPARSKQGNAAFGILRFALLNGTKDGLNAAPPTHPADLALRVGSYPVGVEGPFRMTFNIEVSNVGSITVCKNLNAAYPRFAAVGCAQAKMVSMPVRTDGDGNAVAYVAPFEIDFTTEALPQD